MKEVPFSVPVSGVIRMDGNTITIIVNRAATHVSMETGSESPGRMVFEPGTTMFDILLEAAREFLRRKTYNRFTGPALFDIAREQYPDLKKRSFMSRLTAATPNHSSHKYHLSQRDYFSRIAPGIYSLESQYLPKEALHRVEPSYVESSRNDGK